MLLFALLRRFAFPETGLIRIGEFLAGDRLRSASGAGVGLHRIDIGQAERRYFHRREGLV